MNNNCVWLTNGLYISPKDKEGKFPISKVVAGPSMIRFLSIV